MELEYEDTRRRRVILIAIGVALALIAGGAAFYLVQQAQTAGPQVQLVEAIVAARDIPARTQLQASDLTKVMLPDSAALDQVLAGEDQVVGRITAVAVFPGQPITPNLLASSSAGGLFSILGPTETVAPDSPNWRAVGINVPDDRAVGGQVQAEDRVDVVVTVQVNVLDPEGAAVPLPLTPSPSPRNEPDATGSPAPEASPKPKASPKPEALSQVESPFYTDKSSKITYQDVAVLAKNGTLYILKVDLRTAEEISHLAASGTAAFSLVLRPDADDRAVDTGEYGETTNRIIEKYGLPVPEVYPIPVH